MNADPRTMEFTHRWTIDDFEAKTRTFKVGLICLYKRCPYLLETRWGRRLLATSSFWVDSVLLSRSSAKTMLYRVYIKF